MRGKCKQGSLRARVHSMDGSGHGPGDELIHVCDRKCTSEIREPDSCVLDERNAQRISYDKLHQREAKEVAAKCKH